MQIQNVNNQISFEAKQVIVKNRVKKLSTVVFAAVSQAIPNLTKIGDDSTIIRLNTMQNSHGEPILFLRIERLFTDLGKTIFGKNKDMKIMSKRYPFNKKSDLNPKDIVDAASYAFKRLEELSVVQVSKIISETNVGGKVIAKKNLKGLNSKTISAIKGALPKLSEIFDSQTKIKLSMYRSSNMEIPYKRGIAVGIERSFDVVKENFWGTLKKILIKQNHEGIINTENTQLSSGDIVKAVQSIFDEITELKKGEILN